MNLPIANPNNEAPAESNLLRIAFKGRYLLVIGALIGLGVGYLNDARSQPEFSSAAQLMIASKTTAPIPVDGTTKRDTTDIETHAAVLQSPTLIDRAIRDYDLGSLPVASGGNLRGLIRENLKISPRKGSDAILDVSFKCNDSLSCAKVLNGLLDAFQDFHGEMDQNIGEQMLGLVGEANSVLAKQLSEKQQAYDTFREQSPLVARAGNSLNLHQERMMGIEATRARFKLEVNSLEIEIQAIENAFANGMDVNAIRIMSDQISGNRNSTHPDGTHGGLANNTMQHQLMPMLLELQNLEERYGAQHPDVLSLKRQIDLVKELEPGMDDENGTMKLEDFARSDLEAYLSARRAIRDAKAKELASLNSMFEREQKEARALVSFQVKDSALKSDLQRTQKLFDAVVSRLDEVNLTKDHGGYNIQVLASAEPGWVVSPGLTEHLFRGSILGLFGAFGLAYLIVGRDARFNDTKQVRDMLELPIMGTIPRFVQEQADTDVGDSEVAASIQAFHRPKSSIAESYRGIRTGLFFQLQSKRLVQITSPLPGEGKSTLTTNLATSIAASGKTVIVVDGDLRRPRQHKLLGENAGQAEFGLATILEGRATIQESIYQTSVPNLSLMPCGSIPENPGELLVTNTIGDVLQELCDQFDYVLVDSPPMLAVSDPSTIATLVEGVLLTFDIEKTPRHAVMRAREQLQKIEANIVGVVVNQVETRKRGLYGYGNYNNSYYGYGDYHYATKYIEEAEEPKKPLTKAQRRRAERRAKTGV